MTNQPFHVKQIDHVELYVPDQYQAANWYRDVFGLEILDGYEHWAADGKKLSLQIEYIRKLLADECTLPSPSSSVSLPRHRIRLAKNVPQLLHHRLRQRRPTERIDIGL